MRAEETKNLKTSWSKVEKYDFGWYFVPNWGGGPKAIFWCLLTSKVKVIVDKKREKLYWEREKAEHINFDVSWDVEVEPAFNNQNWERHFLKRNENESSLLPIEYCEVYLFYFSTFCTMEVVTINRCKNIHICTGLGHRPIFDLCQNLKLKAIFTLKAFDWQKYLIAENVWQFCSCFLEPALDDSASFMIVHSPLRAGRVPFSWMICQSVG